MGLATVHNLRVAGHWGRGTRSPPLALGPSQTAGLIQGHRIQLPGGSHHWKIGVGGDIAQGVQSQERALCCSSAAGEIAADEGPSGK